MFHNTHLYFASKLYKSDDPLLLVGSFLPDLAVTKIIKWEGGLHGVESDDNFNLFIQDKFPEYSRLALGVHAHNILDDFTHLKYITEPGYAFQNNEEITKMIGDYYDLNNESARGKAHNFIESAVDILLLKEFPDTQDQLREVIKKINHKQLAIILSAYFKTDRDLMLDSVTKFFDLFTKYDFSKEVNWILFWADLEELLDLNDIGNDKRKKLLDKSIDIVKDTYQDFLSYSITEGEEMIRK